VATATLFVLLAVLVLSGFVHTDDGCLVERHCPACVFALHPADGAGLVIHALAVLECPGGRNSRRAAPTSAAPARNLAPAVLPRPP
jgi:hypothetical protein